MRTTPFCYLFIIFSKLYCILCVCLYELSSQPSLYVLCFMPVFIFCFFFTFLFDWIRFLYRLWNMNVTLIFMCTKTNWYWMLKHFVDFVSYFHFVLSKRATITIIFIEIVCLPSSTEVSVHILCVCVCMFVHKVRPENIFGVCVASRTWTGCRINSHNR